MWHKSNAFKEFKFSGNGTYSNLNLKGLVWTIKNIFFFEKPEFLEFCSTADDNQA